MTLLNDLFSVRTMGEADRLDYIIREHDKLQEQFKSLIATLALKGALTPEEVARLTATSEPPSPGVS